MQRKKIEEVIYIIRGKKVILDEDVAILYGVTTGALNRQVKRNEIRFPSDFMFQLTRDEYKIIIDLQNKRHGGRRTLPLAFTENGIAMLSSVLKSDQAALVNIVIMRTFTKLRQFTQFKKDLTSKVEELESHTNQVIKVVFEKLDRLEKSVPSLPPNRIKIGF